MMSEELMAAAIHGLSSPIAILDEAGTIVDINEAWRTFAVENGSCDPAAYLGKNYLEICRRAAAGGDTLAAEAIAGIASVLSKKVPRFTQRYPCDTPDEARWFRMIVTPLSSGGGVVVTHEDITALVQAEAEVAELERRLALEDQHRFLARETEHRAKNMLAVVLAIANQTALKHVPPASAEKFLHRVEALASSLRLLTGNGCKGANLADLIQSQLVPFADSVANRVAFEGPELAIQPAAAQALGMAFHELATNSLKYGALSAKSGRISVRWGIQNDGRNRHFRIAWIESGGPEAKAPTRSGFGHTVMMTAVEAAINGSVRLDYPASGLVWEAAAPVEAVVLAALAA